MIAELAGKISKNLSNLSDRLEDNLTGNFFGSMRYFPFDRVLKRILISGNNAGFIDEISLESMEERLEFWPSLRYNNTRVEPDLFLDAGKYLIGFEVKLYSGLSQNDDEQEPDQALQSSQQLIKEAHVTINEARQRGKIPALIFVAEEGMGSSIYSQYRGKMPPQIIFSFISWQQILESMKQLLRTENFGIYETIILNDLIRLLEYKGFKRFERVNTENNKYIIKDYFYEFK